MSSKLLSFIAIVAILFFLIDLYLWRALKTTIPSSTFQFLKWMLPLSSLIFVVTFNFQNWRFQQGELNNLALINVLLAISVGLFVVKILMCTIFLTEDIFQVSKWIVGKISNLQNTKQIELDSRRSFVRNIALGVVALPLYGSIYSAFKGKYNFHVKRVKISFPNLPKAFNGLKIVQFTDFHAGSFDDFEKVKQGLSLIHEEDPDLVFFTGDLVNNRAKEAEPYKELFKDISAKIGKYAVLGNHDYGDYIPFETPEERIENLENISSFFQETDFTLLQNESVEITKENAKINIIGVENWGSGRFPKYGDIDKATANIPSDDFNILLSHDPDHWEFIIRKYTKQIDLTLSGHTHGAQFGVEIPGWKWSFVKYRYKRWLGLYRETLNNRYLFVSKGFGFLGYPGRLGMWPEIVVIELRTSE